ncbi:MAG TPA: MBL fold metallo-hydrolase, partial [Burkholderiales bacterium]|nr:MBL fold metallo-hydrolase [Burkholderiales bacterium]
MSVPLHEIYAIKYAHHARRASENFIGGDPHDGPMPLDYFVWAIVGESRIFVVDTGFGAVEAKARKRELLRSPGDGLKAIGIDPAKVADVIVTHMHYDHAGNLD